MRLFRQFVSIFLGLVIGFSGIVITPKVQAQSTCTLEHVSVPLNDLGAGQYLRMTGPAPYTYQPTAFIGGLYPGGSNVRPAQHETDGLQAAAQIQPLNSQGDPSSTGKIGFAAIGMSNTTLEFKQFMSMANADPAKNPKVVLINGAHSGGVIQLWINPNEPGYTTYWNNLSNKVIAAGLTDAQVQVLWVKITQTDTFSFPQDMQILEERHETLLQMLKTKFPNLKVTYVSSRTRSGSYFTNPRFEPTAFENGLAVRWLMEQQINGDANLNFKPELGPVRTSYLSWGPYLWIDGNNPRSDGRTWPASYLNSSDCVHPTTAGAYAVGQMLLQFLKTDTTATPWFLNPGAPTPTRTPTPSQTPAPSPTATPTLTPTPTPPPHIGDADLDSDVDNDDLTILLENYHSQTTEGAIKADFNLDTYVDGIDYVIWFSTVTN